MSFMRKRKILRIIGTILVSFGMIVIGIDISLCNGLAIHTDRAYYTEDI